MFVFLTTKRENIPDKIKGIKSRHKYLRNRPVCSMVHSYFKVSLLSNTKYVKPFSTPKPQQHCIEKHGLRYVSSSMYYFLIKTEETVFFSRGKTKGNGVK